MKVVRDLREHGRDDVGIDAHREHGETEKERGRHATG
jgi:hypothetical protein